MPKYIEVWELDYFKLRRPDLKISEELKGFVGIAHPGSFIAVAETSEEAFALCKLRLRAAKAKHAHKWTQYASKRESLIEELLEKKGLLASSVWEEDDIGRVDNDS